MLDRQLITEKIGALIEDLGEGAAGKTDDLATTVVHALVFFVTILDEQKEELAKQALLDVLMNKYKPAKIKLNVYPGRPDEPKE